MIICGVRVRGFVHDMLCVCVRLPSQRAAAVAEATKRTKDGLGAAHSQVACNVLELFRQCLILSNAA